MSFLSKLAVLASGNGSNLQVILDQTRSGQIPAEVVIVISDKKDAYSLKRAEKLGVEHLFLSSKSYPSRESYDEALVNILHKKKVDWVVLAGFMRILSSTFVRPFLGKILNIHPSLLPQYPGLNAIERTFRDGKKLTGVTIHFVDEGVDTGPIILQETIAIHPQESLENLTERVHELEHRLYPQALCLVLQGKICFKRGEIKRGVK